MITRRNTLKLLTGLVLCPGGFHTIVQPKKLILPEPINIEINKYTLCVIYKLIDGHQRLEANSGLVIKWIQK